MAGESSINGSGGAGNGALRRKLGAMRPPGLGEMTPAKALRQLLPRVAEERFGLAVSVVEAGEDRRVAAEHLPARLCAEAEEAGGGADGSDGGGADRAAESGSLLLALDREGGARAFAVPDAQLLAALIEVQTLGRVLPVAALPRPPTPTDAAMCRDFIDLLLQRLEGALARPDPPFWVTGYGAGPQIENLRLLEMMLGEIPYRLFSLVIDIDGGAKTGRLQLAFPALSPPGAQAGCTVPDRSWRDIFTEQVMHSRARLDAVLHRLHLPLAELRGLKAGDLLPVPLSAVGNVVLECGARQDVALARLGQKGGLRAVRLKSEIAAEAAAAGAWPETSPAAASPPAGAPGPSDDMGDMIAARAGKGASPPGGNMPGGATGMPAAPGMATGPSEPGADDLPAPSPLPAASPLPDPLPLSDGGAPAMPATETKGSLPPLPPLADAGAAMHTGDLPAGR